MKVLLTAVGCPGASTLIRMLKANEVEVHGVDMDLDVVGRWLCDSFHQVPSGESNDFIGRVIDLCQRLEVDALLPESSNEVSALSLHREEFPCPVLVSEPEAVANSLDKARMYRKLEESRFADHLPQWRLAKDLDELLDQAEEMGLRDGRPVVMKPSVGKGSRGVRIVDPELDPYEHFLHSKPDNKRITPMMLEAMMKDRGNSEPFEIPMMVMEYLGEEQRTVDAICSQGKMLLSSVKTVERARWGVVTLSTLVEDLDLTRQTEDILNQIPLSWCINVQFIGRKLIEINPRVSSFVHQEEVCFPYLALRKACGMSVDWNEARRRIKVGRRMVRYMDQVFE